MPSCFAIVYFGRVNSLQNDVYLLALLKIADVSSPNYFAQLFATATAQTIRSCTFKIELQHVFNRMRSVHIEWTSNYIIQQFFLHIFRENENITVKYLEYYENIMKKDAILK